MKSPQEERADLSLTKKLEKYKEASIYLSRLDSSLVIEIKLLDTKTGDVTISFMHYGRTMTDKGSLMFMHTNIDEVEMLVNVSKSNYYILKSRGEMPYSKAYGIYKEMLKLVTNKGEKK